MGRREDFLLPNAPTCIVACTATVARLWYSTSRFGDWSQLAEFTNPAAASRESDFGTDRPGRTFDSFGSGRHAMVPGETRREHETHRFAAELADRLNRGVAGGDFEHLVLIAAPAFLGHLRAELSDAATRAVIYEAAKDLTWLDVDRIREHFR